MPVADADVVRRTETRQERAARQQRIDELRKQIRDAEELIGQGTIGGVPVDDINVERLKEERERALEKIKLLQRYGQYTPESRKQIDLLTSRELSPYLEGSGDNLKINIERAVISGKDDLLKEAGITDAQLKQARINIRVRGEQRKQLGQAVRQQRAAIKKLEGYRQDGGYNLTEIGNDVRKGDLSITTVRNAGFRGDELLAIQRRAAGEEDIKYKLSAVSGVEDYAIKPSLVQKDQRRSYDIAKYLRDNPNGIKALKDFGFTDKQIATAQKYNRENPWLYETPRERLDAYLKQNNIFITPGQGKYYMDVNGKYKFVKFKDLDSVKDQYPELPALQAALKDGKTKKADVSLQQFTANFMASRGVKDVSTFQKGGEGSAYQKAQTVKQYAAEEYIRRYGYGSAARSAYINVATYAFPPARALQPEYKVSDITPLEWGIGAANVVLIAAPVVTAPLKGVGALTVTRAGIPVAGRTTAYIAANTAIRAGAAAIYTTHTVQNWGSMNNVERAISVLIDSALIGSAVSGSVRGVRSIKAPKQARFKFDFSAKAQTVTNNAKVASALDTMQEAMQKQDVRLLRAGARQLELAGADVPKQLGGNAIVQKARLIAGNAKEYLKLGKTPPKGVDADIVKNGLAANRKHLDLLVQQLKRTKKAATRQAIEQAIKETKKQIATKVKVKMPEVKVRETTERVPREYSLVPAKETKEILSKSKKTVRVDGRSIPVKEFAESSVRQVAKKYSVSSAAVINAVSNMPIKERLQIASVRPDLPLVEPSPYKTTRIQPVEVPEVAVQPETKTVPKLQPRPTTTVKPETKPEESTSTQPKPETPFTPAPPTTAPPVATPAETPTEETTTTRGRIPFNRRLDELSDKERKGVIAWKQGIVYIVIFPPYRTNNDVYYRRKKPEGVRIEKDAQGAYQTIQTLSGRPPDSQISLKLGFERVTIKPKTGQVGEQGAIVFRPISGVIRGKPAQERAPATAQFSDNSANAGYWDLVGFEPF